MKILLAHKYFYLNGGADIFYFETERVLKSNGHDIVHFSTIDPKNKFSDFSRFFVAPPEYNVGSFLKRISEVGSVIYSVSTKNKFAQLLALTKPDIIHVFAMHVHLSPSILVAAFEAKIPVVMSCNDYKHICPNYKLYHHGRICEDCKGGKFYKAVVNKCCKDSLSFSVVSSIEAYFHNFIDVYSKYVNTYLFSSDFMAAETARFWSDKKFKSAKLMNPFNSIECKASWVYDDYALYFGRFVEEKGVDVLLRAAKLSPLIPIKIIGDGPELANLTHLREQLGLFNVEFLGPLWGDDLDNVLSKARFVVVPSVWHENFPYVINQSFAHGKAVIGSNRGGITEMIEHENRGLIYDADDALSLSVAMNQLWDSPQKCEQMGRNAKTYVDETFSDEAFYGTLIQIYQGVLDECASSRR